MRVHRAGVGRVAAARVRAVAAKEAEETVTAVAATVTAEEVRARVVAAKGTEVVEGVATAVMAVTAGLVAILEVRPYLVGKVKVVAVTVVEREEVVRAVAAKEEETAEVVRAEV